MSLAQFSYIIFILAVLTQLILMLHYFYAFARHKSKRIGAENSVFLPLTVLIVVRNEKANLIELLPALLNQDYPDYNILIMDDHSTDGTGKWISDLLPHYPKLKYHHLNEPSSGKKAGLSAAIPYLNSDLILFTDADCRPQSNQWLRLMTTSLSPEQVAVLGYSPFLEKSGLLNEVVRLETAYTASLYFSFALKDQAYMGVGRNMLFRTSDWKENFQPFRFGNLKSGDDDLTINHLSSSLQIGIQYDPNSWMYSVPKTTWKQWLAQKQRHVTTARHYKSNTSSLLFLYYSSLVMTWMALILLGFFNFWIWIFGLVYKITTYLFFIKPCISKLGVPLKFWNWIRAEFIYVLSLIYLLPFSTYKKTSKW